MWNCAICSVVRPKGWYWLPAHWCDKPEDEEKETTQDDKWKNEWKDDVWRDEWKEQWQEGWKEERKDEGRDQQEDERKWTDECNKKDQTKKGKWQWPRSPPKCWVHIFCTRQKILR